MGSYEKEPIVNTLKRGDWRDQLAQDGFVVLKGVVSRDNAQSYLDSLFAWLESFPFGFRQSDPSTWDPEYLPAHMKSASHSYLPKVYSTDLRCT